MLPRPVVIGLVVLVAIVWAANLIVGWFYPDRNDPAVNAIFAVVMSGVYGLGRVGRSPREQRDALRRRAAGAMAQLLEPDPEPDPPKRGDQP